MAAPASRVDAAVRTPGPPWALVGASTLVALLLCEMLFRAVVSAPPPFRYPQLRYRPDPDLGFAFIPGEVGFTTDELVTINTRGLRGPVVPYARSTGRLRILVLGDSIVFGYGVADDAVMTARLEALLAARGVPSEVIDAGVPGYNTEQEVRFLEREGVRYRPDWVIVGLCWNDVTDQSRMRVSPEGLLGSGEHERPGRLAAFLESAPGYALRNLLKRSRLLYASATAWRSFRARDGGDEQWLLRADLLDGRQSDEIADGWRRIGVALHRMQELAAENGFRTVVVPFPIGLQLARDFPHSSYPSEVQALAEREGIAVIDVEQTFRRAYRGHDSLFVPYDDDHPNAAGHELTAEQIADFVAPR